MSRPLQTPPAPDSHGYFLHLSPKRFALFSTYADNGREFAEPVEDFALSLRSKVIVFVTQGRDITHIALGTKGNRSGSGMRRIEVDSIAALNVPVPLDSIKYAIPAANRRFIEPALSVNALVSKKSLSAVVSSFKKEFPEAYNIAIKLSNKEDPLNKISIEAKRALAFQKEALLTAFCIAGYDRECLKSWQADQQPEAFLSGLDACYLREDAMIVHDLSRFPGYEKIKDFSLHSAVFSSHGTMLRVILANRLPLESQLGTDLIYFNETFSSFVMVQYKAMEHESHQGEPVFRLPDDKLEKQIDKMKTLLHSIQTQQAENACNGFRLHNNPFFIKLCPRIVFTHDEVDLIKGMYFPLDYWETLAQSEMIDGPRRGKYVSFSNSGRYLTNTDFAVLVGSAWVGTTPSQSRIIMDIVHTSIEADKGAMLVIESKAHTIG